MTRLVHTGNVLVDVALTIDRLPDPGSDVLASSSSLAVGGAFNTLVAARRDGLPAVHVGARGTGVFAALVDEALAGAGIEALGPVVDLDTGYSVVLVDADAERTFVTSVGAEGRLTRRDLDAVALEPGDIVVVSGYSLAHSPTVLPGWVTGLDAGVRVVFDPSPLVGSLPGEALAAVLARADVVTANVREAHLLARHPAGSLRPDAVFVVRAGALGCWILEPAALFARRIPGFPALAVDTTGAGDAHCGVLCAGLARGDAPDVAARRANAAASIAVTRRGPATAPGSAEIEALLLSGVDRA